MTTFAARSVLRIFAAPAAIAIVSLLGLVVALLGNGLLDGLSWIGLAVPLVVIGWALSCRRL